MAIKIKIGDDGYIQILDSADGELEILTREDIDAALKENKTVADLQTEIKNLKTQIGKGEDGLLGEYTDYAVIGVGVFALLMFILCIYLIRGISKEFQERLTRGLRGREDEIRENREKIASLNMKITSLEKSLREFELELSKKKNLEKTSPAASAPFPLPQPPPLNTPTFESPKPSLEEKYAEFVQEFNGLADLSGYESKKSVENFKQKYRVQTFSCTNAEMRVKAPTPPAEFGDDSAGNYWAFEVAPGIFAVVPNVKNYGNNHHFQQAMGEVFDSDFVNGNTYSKIRVEKPAVFNGKWTLETKGKLRLG